MLVNKLPLPSMVKKLRSMAPIDIPETSTPGSELSSQVCQSTVSSGSFFFGDPCSGYTVATTGSPEARIVAIPTLPVPDTRPRGVPDDSSVAREYTLGLSAVRGEKSFPTVPLLGVLIDKLAFPGLKLGERGKNNDLDSSSVFCQRFSAFRAL